MSVAKHGTSVTRINIVALNRKQTLIRVTFLDAVTILTTNIGLLWLLLNETQNVFTLSQKAAFIAHTYGNFFMRVTV